jgi:antitoxin (DNA-binding transcriptional repressor) of toxin-antitoxin stability system
LISPPRLANNRIMQKIHSVHAAKTNLSKLIERAEAGESIVIARGKVPAVRLVRADSKTPSRKFGAMKGRARTTRAFFAPLPDDELNAWER